ncbi:COP9 signalosome complex subunit 7-like isoform X3 [Phoenix dactylifera]|uniref:COP9 signalosome complex subunit 7-like isoform X3 n=1 Tax=Phoenix dactylifera TaxID=42345 RepID=A0A8B7BVH8_PHODC|nr:COP9 signalosome complex subunit 7-like isoform X3 [Phoenix dactylifera]
MDIERKHAELIDLFVKQAAVLDGPALAGLVLEASSHPSLFAFSEILSVPNLAKLEGTLYSSSLDVLRLFAYGTWSDYKCNAGSLPALSFDQVRKLKQLSVLTLAETNKGIVRGKLDQLSRCFEVQFAAGRDLRPEQLNSMIQTLAHWLDTSDSLLHLIQDKIKWADTMSEATKKHRKEIEDRVEEVKKSLKADMDLRSNEEMFFEHGGMMDYEEDRVRPKRRRAPMP